MTYKICEKLIILKKNNITGQTWDIFVSDMVNKLDVFLLNNRITSEEYNALLSMLV